MPLGFLSRLSAGSAAGRRPAVTWLAAGAFSAALEYLAGFTLVGYMLAEARGRREDALVDGGARVAVACGAGAAPIELLRGFHPAHGASLVHLALATATGLYGGLVYRLQLAVVRRLLGGDR